MLICCARTECGTHIHMDCLLYNYNTYTYKLHKNNMKEKTVDT